MAFNILSPSLLPDISNLSGITEAGGVFAAAASKLTALVRPDNPPYGIAGYVFDVVDSYVVEMKSEITTKKLEEADLKNDRSGSIKNFEITKEYKKPWIELAPETITVRGAVAEVSSTVPLLSEYVEPYVRALDTVAAYVPEFAVNARRAYAEAERVARVTDKVVKQAKSLHDLYKDKWGKDKKPNDERDVPQTKQREVFEFFRYLWASKQLVTVETAWGVYKQMAIASITATQDSSRYISSFTMVFKQLVTVKKDEVENKMSAGANKYYDKGAAGKRVVKLDEAFKDFPATGTAISSPKAST